MSRKASGTIEKLSHHKQQEYCHTRSPYRQGKKLTAVKVYTVNDESEHLIINNVPKLQLSDEIKRLISSYGELKLCQVITNYPSPEFTEAFHVQFKRIQSARIAKRLLDNKNFYGGVLHVFYAPELEDVCETRNKLVLRKKEVLMRIKTHMKDPTCVETDEFLPREQYHRKKKHPALSVTAQQLSQEYKGSNDDLAVESRLSSNEENKLEKINYKGHAVRNHMKIIRPKLIDTKKLIQHETTNEQKNKFHVVKKIDNIKIRLPGLTDARSKRIIIKNSSTTRLINCSETLQTSIQSVKSSIRQAMQKD